jgi:DNA-binding GntR family transcriptional regulator
VLSKRGLLNVVPRRGYVLKRAIRDQDLESYSDLASDDDKLVQRMAADRFSGDLPDSVTETDLMRRYGVARGALHRVLNSLVQDNDIERRSGHGWRFLPAVDAAKLHEDSYRFRLLIEPACVLEPTFRLDKPRAQRLRQVHVDLMSDGLEKLGSSRFFELNAEFHEFVASCARNRFLEQAVIHQNRLRRFFSYITVFTAERMRVSCSEHVAILDRLIAGEREHAATLLWRHLLGASRVKPRFQ